MPKCCPLFLAVGSKVRMRGGGSRFSLSILACSFLGTCLPAKLELEGKSRTDGGARVGGENSSSIILLPRPPNRSLGCLAAQVRRLGSVFRTKGFPLWVGLGVFPDQRNAVPVSPQGEKGGKGRQAAEAPRQLSSPSMLFGPVKGTALGSQQQAET